MKPVSLFGAGLLVLALVLAASHARATTTSAPVAAECSVEALTASLSGGEPLVSVAGYACEGPWAYLWATFGSGASAVSTTNVFRFDATTGRWFVTPRIQVCQPSVLPSFIYKRGCFSN